MTHSVRITPFPLSISPLSLALLVLHDEGGGSIMTLLNCQYERPSSFGYPACEVAPDLCYPSIYVSIRPHYDDRYRLPP